jgi:hypothetical protein
VESLPVFSGNNEGLDHFCLLKVSVELVQLVQPVGLAIRIRNAPQITKVFHQHEPHRDNHW